MSFFSEINYAAVFVATLVYFVIGFLWYSKIFGETWRSETGVPADKKPGGGALIGQFVSTFIFNLGIAIVMQLSNIPDVSGGILAGLLVAVFFGIPINTGNLFFTGKTKLFFIDSCERAFGSIVVGIILGIWR